MKCTLIRCPQTFAKYVSAASAIPPIGPAYVAASLREAGHQVAIIDTTGEALDRFTPMDEQGILLRRGISDAEILERLEHSDVIGFSLMFSQDWLPARELIRKVRAHYPGAALVGGGEHFTAEPVGALEDSPLDFILEGEGDRLICGLLEHLTGRRPLDEVPGCWYRTADGEVRRSCAKVRVRDVDSLPWPAWNLVPLENYLRGHYGAGVDRGRSMPMNATRGCPYQCTFCSSPTMWTTRYVTRSPADVVAEIKHYIATYGATNFDFQGSSTSSCTSRGRSQAVHVPRRSTRKCSRSSCAPAARTSLTPLRAVTRRRSASSRRRSRRIGCSARCGPR